MKYIIFLLKLEEFWGRRRRIRPHPAPQYLFLNLFCLFSVTFDIFDCLFEF